MADDMPDLARGVRADAIEADRPLAGTVAGDPVVLVRHEGRLCALAGECTHQGAPLADGLFADGLLRCPWHHARFLATTGEAVAAPAFAPLDRYEVIEDADGTVRVGGKLERETAVPEAAGGPIVIVGGGAAGHACADMLARLGHGGRVTMLSDDADPPYDRTMCSKQYLAGEETREATALPDPAVGAPPAIRAGVRVVAIDPAGRAVVTDDGERIDYATLVLATGAEPGRPEGVGDDVLLLRTLADADALVAAATSARTAIVIGASFIALEVAAALVARELDVTVVGEDEVPLAKVLGAEAGGFVRSLHEKEGVTFRLGEPIARAGNGEVVLESGETLAADLIVAGTGVTPRIGLAEQAGLAIADEDEGGGIRVDGRLATSADGIFAIGDVASCPDPRLGRRVRIEHWVHAQRMGQHLARLLAGAADADFGDTPFFWSAHYGVGIHYSGHAGSADERRVEGDAAAGDFAVRLREDGADRALATCGDDRDGETLTVELAWDR